MSAGLVFVETTEIVLQSCNHHPGIPGNKRVIEPCQGNEDSGLSIPLETVPHQPRETIKNDDPLTRFRGYT